MQEHMESAQHSTATNQLSRLEKTLTLINKNKGEGLEIGACCSPLLRKNEARLRYVDYLPTNKLREKYASPQFLGEVPVDEIVDVDVVWEVGKYLKNCLSIPNPVDWVLASHVVEHTTNLVGWLAEIEDVLVPGGVLSLIIPDKQFTFDMPRAESTFGDVLEAHLTQEKLPRLKNVYDYFATAVRVAPEDLTQTTLAPENLPLYYSEGIAVTEVRALDKTKAYVDIHNLILTPWSFREIFSSMILHGLTGFEIGAFFPTAPNDFEFFVSLVKTPENGSNEEKRAQQLRSLPNLPPHPSIRNRKRLAELEALFAHSQNSNS